MKKIERSIARILLILMIFTMSNNGFSIQAAEGGTQQNKIAEYENVKESNAADEIVINKFTSSKASPQLVNTSMTLSADAIGGSGTLQYRYSYRDSLGKKIVIRIFSKTKSVVWTPKQAGTYNLLVEVKDSTGKIKSKLMKYVVGNSISINELKVDKEGLDLAGTKFRLTSNAIGGTGGLKYRFTCKDPSGNRIIIRNFNSEKTTTWIPTVNGKYLVYVEVKDSIGIIKTKSMEFEVKSSILKINSLTTDMRSPQNIGTRIRITAEASGGEGKVKYRYCIKNASGKLQEIRKYSSDKSFEWKADITGDIIIYVQVKDSKGKIVTKGIKYTVTNIKANRPLIPMENTIESRTIKEPVDIYWNEDSSLKSYKLEYIKRETEATFKEPKDAESSYIKINEGTNASKNSVLGTFDPTLMENGLYKVRLIGIKEDNKEVKMTAIYLVTGGMKIGNFTLSNDDLNIPLAGLPITVTRNYDSRKSNQKGDFGNGWDLGLSNLKLEITSNIGEKGWYQQITKSGFFSLYEIKESKEHKVTITYPTGEVEEFSVGVTPNSQRLYPIENVKMTFTAKNGSKATLRDLDEKYFWVSGGASASGSNLELISSSGDGFNPTKFEYTDKNGIKYIISKANGVEKIIYLDGDYVLLEKEKLTYKSASDNTEKIVNIVRDSTNKITQINDFDGKSIKYEYDSNNNLTKVIDREGRETSYSYANNKLVGIKGYKDITPARYEYDNNNRMTAYIDSYGARTEYSFNEGVKQYVVKDAMGYVSIYEYDSRGNIISYTDKENNKTLYEYDDNDKLIKETDCLGNIYKYEYSKEGNLLSKEDPLGNKREATYNRFGEMLTISDAEKNIITNDYDSNGRLIEAKDPYGNIQKFTYTRDEKPESITDALGKVKKFTYDEKNHLKTMTDENGNVTNYVYDDEGRCLSKSIEVTKGEAKEIVTVSYQYDKYNNIIKATDSKGNSTTYEYKGNTDLVVKATDKNGRVTRYEYDDYGNVSKVIYPDNTYETYTYDKLRNMLKSIDANGYETKYAYDKMSRLSKVEYPNGLIINYTYDGNGNLLKVKSSDLKEVNYTYDSAGRNTEVKDALGKITKYNYDKNGNIIEQIDANGNSIKYEYDKLGRKTKITVGDISTSCTYDAIGRIASKTDGEGNTTSYEYDATSNLIGVTDALGNKTSYKYNEIGKLIEETDANGNTTKYEYDTLGRTISRTLPLGQKESYEYDNNSNLISVIDFNGRKSTYTYDKKNQLTSKKLADGKITKYSYDKKGQLLSVKDNTGTIKLEYDNVGNLKSKTDVNGEKIEYTYDYQGNILSLKTPNTISKYAYDKAGKLLSVEDKYGNKTSYTYDNVGNLIKEIKGNNSYTSYEYDKAYRLIKLTNYKSSGQIISSYKYSLDKRGLRTKVEENNGKVTEYKYDELGRLLSEKVIKASKTTETKYSYDKVSNRISKIEDGKKIKYSYDKNNRLLKEGNISYTYDKAGNLTKKQSTSETISYI